MNDQVACDKFSEDNYEDGNPPSGYTAMGNPSGCSAINDLRIGSIVEKGSIDADNTTESE